jgi:hypothetical protein
MNQILPAEHYGTVEVVDGHFTIGNLSIPWSQADVQIYVRRFDDDQSIAEVLIARHDGLAQEELEQQNYEASIAPEGPKEYWRAKMVGQARYGVDQHIMTDAEFEDDWEGE